MLFNFVLKPPLECAFPRGNEEGNRHVCWFYLTDSEYYIDLGTAKLFESSLGWMEKYKNDYPSGIRFVDYQYSRQLEDLFEILPTISCPMPGSLYTLVETDEKRELLYDKIMNLWDETSSGQWNEEDEKYANIVRNLICYGSLDSGYLRFRSECQFFNVDGEVIIQYNFNAEDEGGCPVWSAGKGSYTLTYKEFVYEIENLLNRFFAAMDKQIETALQVFNESELKASNLVSEHTQRKDYFYGILNAIKNNAYENLIDWKNLKEDLERYLTEALTAEVARF